ncbi:hypothetical protein KFK09_009364 [Dendrobium nobile]|uniref:Bifunctional inhibitor/plant lipid transfer protein/seed storage helical domain-containing protein n=1 Tax=Dendrobium nobile TaxID=94219 RepID=A0A8T3BNK6_DENNO|nr:hypothetical protein KFK09_009364 [Dendrobium nobile]
MPGFSPATNRRQTSDLHSSPSFERVNGAGECGSTSADTMAFQMAPCASASQDVNAAVSASCCSAIQKIGQNPKCLCAVMLSNTAKSAGVNPGVAVTIPKRCEIANRPVIVCLESGLYMVFGVMLLML